MKKLGLFTITLVILLSCQHDKTIKNTSVIVNETKPTEKIKFRYKDIFINKNVNDTIQPKNIKELFGVWNIDSIADVGGTMQNEKLIQSQIGHELLINQSQFSLRFLNDNLKIAYPDYLITKSPNSKGSTFWYGYKNSRKYVTFIKVNESCYIEVVNNHELAYYFDGRIYFFKRKI